MSKPCSGPGMTSPSEVRRNRVKTSLNKDQWKEIWFWYGQNQQRSVFYNYRQSRFFFLLLTFFIPYYSHWKKLFFRYNIFFISKMKNTWSWSLVAIRSCWISRMLTGSRFTFTIIWFSLDLCYTSYYFATLFDFSILEKWCKCTLKRNKQKIL